MKHISLIVASVFAFLVAPVAQANLIYFSASLSGMTEFPTNDSQGTGTGFFTFDTSLHTMRAQISFSGLTGTTTASHIHCCTTVPGVANASVATELPLFTGFPTGVTSGTYDHTFDLTLLSSFNPAFVTANGGTTLAAETALINGALDGKAYLNIHSTYKTGGEIRGFLAVPEPTTFSLLSLGLLGIGFFHRRRAH